MIIEYGIYLSVTNFAKILSLYNLYGDLKTSCFESDKHVNFTLWQSFTIGSSVDSDSESIADTLPTTHSSLPAHNKSLPRGSLLECLHT
jgi:hypothetical protein